MAVSRSPSLASVPLISLGRPWQVTMAAGFGQKLKMNDRRLCAEGGARAAFANWCLKKNTFGTGDDALEPWVNRGACIAGQAGLE
jgi:hypothetical protein